MTDRVTRLNAAPEGRYRIEREIGEAGISTEPSFRVTEQQVLFPVDADLLVPQGEQYTLYDITPDGQRFVMMGLERSEDAEVILITNWLTEVSRPVPR